MVNKTLGIFLCVILIIHNIACHDENPHGDEIDELDTSDIATIIIYIIFSLIIVIISLIFINFKI
jgi:hypothetical protein